MVTKVQVVREGYKITELGEIPVEWEVVRLEEIIKIINGYAFQSEFYSSDGEFILLTPGNFQPEGGLKLKGEKEKYFIGEINNKYLLKKGDLLIVLTDLTPSCNILGSPAFIVENNKFLHNQRLGKIELVNRNIILKEFLFNLFNWKEYRKELKNSATGTTVRHTSVKKVLEVNVPLPTIPEQQKIAEILSTVDEQIENTEQLIRKTKELKKGLMQQLLTKGIGHTEFKVTELGEIPFDWEVKELGSVLKVLGGFAFKSKDASETGVRWVKIANVGLGKVNWGDISFLPTSYSEKYKEYQINFGDIIMAMTRPVLNGITKIAVFDREEIALLNQRVCKFIINTNLCKNYFFQLANSSTFANNIEYLIAGTDPPNISAQQIKSILIPFPTFEEQQKIAEILLSVDKQIEGHEKEKEIFQKLKKGLMKQLLTGKIRVTV
jgi:type I restriction enzyme, S subunit